MARLRLLDNHEIDPGMRAVIEAFPKGRHEFVRVFAHAPDIYKSYMSFYEPLRDTGRLETKLKELVRLKIAAINECRF